MLFAKKHDCRLVLHILVIVGIFLHCAARRVPSNHALATNLTAKLPAHHSGRMACLV